MKRITFYLVLRPMILANYWLRYHRFLRDGWFWADRVATSWGYWAP